VVEARQQRLGVEEAGNVAEGTGVAVGRVRVLDQAVVVVVETGASVHRR
jgi:hypothetical protein